MRKILLVISIVLFWGTSFAQNNIINETTFDNLVEYVSCRYANQYILNYPNKIDKNNRVYIDSIKPKLDNCTLNNHLSHNDLYDLLYKNLWKGTANSLIKNWSAKKRFNDVTGKDNSFIIEYIVNIDDNFKTIIGFNFVDSTEVELLNKYVTHKNFKTQTDSVINTISSKEKQGIIKKVISEINDTNSNFSLWIVVIVEALFILALIILQIKQRRDVKSGIESFKTEKGKRVNNDREFIIQHVLGSNRIANKFKSNNNSVEIFEDKLQQLDKRLGQLQFEVNKLTPTEILSNQLVQKLNREETDLSKSEIKYLKEKQGMLLFKETVKEAAYYEIFNINGNKASYSFCGDIGRAMANYDTVLKDVFDDQKTYSSKAKQIINTKNGVVELQADGKWEIKTPAKIKFI